MPTEKEFIQSIEQNQQIVHKVCNLYMNNEQDKKDLFQEIVLSAWKGYRNFKGEAKFSTWLYRVALNTAITFYRKEKRQVETTAYKEHYATIISDTQFKEDEQLAAMHKAVADLSKIDKGLVMLYLEDYNYQDIGDIMGISPNNVAVKMNRIKIKLKENSKKYL
jgi:RNA polymerase sigma factor (sigma-70 family)